MDGNRLAALPPEITRSILRFATDVPVAVDASLETSLNEDPLETRALVEQSLDLKRTISLVSKSFHALVEEFLYEIILIRRPTGIARLVAHLREKRPGYTDRGWWVRRLELDFEVSRTMMTWNAGWDTLWGLLSACAHLQVFRLAPRGSVRAQLQHRRYYYYDWCASCSAKLLRNLAVLHGRTLRRIEFGDNIVPQPDHFAQFLSLLPALESSTALSIGYVGDTIADLGPTPEEDVSPWPEGLPEDSRLLHLHTLHMELGELPRQLAAWRLPNLKHLHVVRADDIPMDKHVFEFLRAHDCTIRSLYHERQEYNPFGRLWQRDPAGIGCSHTNNTITFIP
ncbi:hypothetical protein CALCODRAFT_511325 [Calocera cornea HHB12733]|uniref:F-box domain-containing protein n=1 Tax=Calocera cornea HHB12733 TaxID=1353952 RepID=A0A165DVD1_9BASI|nr:hypothetical protein CALCODRAFT_511325 [Calocera cornea HHB12733]